MTIQELAQQKILILDGAMGTMIQRHKLTEEDFRGNEYANIDYSVKGNNDMLSITQFDIIKNIHKEYLQAGADIIETNTFSSNRISMADYNMQDRETVKKLNVESVRAAKQAIAEYQQETENRPAFVAGAIGPTNKTASLSPDVNDPGYRELSYLEFAEIYQEQAEALIEGGADLLLVETIFDTLNAKAAFYGIEEAFEKLGKRIPLMASGTITDKSGRTLSGQTTEAFLISLSHVPLFSIGLNCALGASDLEPYLKILSKEAPFHISAYPNAGLPNAFGEYDESPEDMEKQVTEYLKENIVNILGGCCGTTPNHIAAMAKSAKNFNPRKIQS